jgi:hypothetical protein
MFEPIAFIVLSTMLIGFCIYMGVSIWRENRKIWRQR